MWAAFVVLAISIFFWGRGVFRQNRGDLVAGVVILLVAFAMTAEIDFSSGVFADIGIELMIFGLLSAIFSFRSGPVMPADRLRGICCRMLARRVIHAGDPVTQAFLQKAGSA